MQNFREKHANRISIFLFLFVPILWYGIPLAKYLPWGMFFYFLSIPLVFILSLLFRLVSLSPARRWWDFLFVILSSFVGYSSIVLSIIFLLIAVILAITSLVADFKLKNVESV